MDVSATVSNDKAGLNADNTDRMLEDHVLIADYGYNDILDITLDPQNNNALIFTTNYLVDRVNVITDALTATGGGAIPVSKEGTGLPANIPVYCAIVEMANSDIAYIGTEEGIYKTENFTDVSPTWVLYNNGINAKVPVFKLYQQTNYISGSRYREYDAQGVPKYTPFQGVKNYGMIYAATHGLGVFIDTFYYNAIPEWHLPFEKSKSVNLTVFPNPAANNITVDFTIASTRDVLISISDITGKTILTKSLGARMIGNHQEKIDCSVLSEGFYFVTVNAGEQNQSAKIVIRK
jgi:hypothetical protein